MLALLVVAERFDFASQEACVDQRFMWVKYEVENLCADWDIWHHEVGEREARDAREFTFLTLLRVLHAHS